jgi:hypothetical protein
MIRHLHPLLQSTFEFNLCGKEREKGGQQAGTLTDIRFCLGEIEGRDRETVLPIKILSKAGKPN